VKKTLVVTLLVCATLLFVRIAGASADRVQAGMWETKMTIGSAKPMVSKHCITASEATQMNGDAAALRKYVEQSTAAKTRGRCSVKSVKVEGNRTIVTIACGKTEVVGTTTYHGDHYESTSSNGTVMVGKRLGACP
jgi:hypothetical protein